ncbi:MAG: hypothetical protein PVJ92_01515 [Candidatus Dependentiae bacterium]|jgi:hypothetical protein
MKKKTTSQTHALYSKKNRRRIAFILALCGAFATLTYGYLRFYRTAPPIKEVTAAEGKQPWMVIFMHGSFGTMFGLMSFFKVMRDDVENTTYKKMSSHMRHDPFFHQLQPILAPGLHRFEPTFNPPAAEENKHHLAVFPVSAAYKHLHEQMRSESEKHYFYTFGWSGLVSQQRRRREAVRFYNMLHQEYHRFLKQGITPKIRILVHSHGGNVALNMAGVSHLMEAGLNNIPDAKTYADKDERESLEELHKVLVQLPKKEKTKQLPHQKKWDFMPPRSPLRVDEMVLLGTPVQAETAHFFTYPFFKKIYHVYSAGDSIQGFDWVSTKRYNPEQRLPFTPTNTNPDNTVVQVRLTMNKNKPVSENEGEVKEESPQPAVEGSVFSNVLGALFGAKKGDGIPDPGHKELWFMGWKGQGNEESAQRHIQPYPYVILWPLIQQLVDKHPDLHDVDVRLKFKEEKISLVCHPHGSTTKRHKVFLPRAEINALQEKAHAWEPTNVSREHEMNILHRYAQKLA